jgi:kynurenine formamidase
VLEAGIGIVEALVNLKELVGKRFFFAALPLKIAGGDGSPVRAVALFDDAPK